MEQFVSEWHPRETVSFINKYGIQIVKEPLQILEH